MAHISYRLDTLYCLASTTSLLFVLYENLGEIVNDGVSMLSVKWMGAGIIGPETSASRRYSVSFTVVQLIKSNRQNIPAKVYLQISYSENIINSLIIMIEDFD